VVSNFAGPGSWIFRETQLQHPPHRKAVYSGRGERGAEGLWGKTALGRPLGWGNCVYWFLLRWGLSERRGDIEGAAGGVCGEKLSGAGSRFAAARAPGRVDQNAGNGTTLSWDEKAPVGPSSRFLLGPPNFQRSQRGRGDGEFFLVPAFPLLAFLCKPMVSKTPRGFLAPGAP